MITTSIVAVVTKATVVRYSFNKDNDFSNKKNSYDFVRLGGYINITATACKKNPFTGEYMMKEGEPILSGNDITFKSNLYGLRSLADKLIADDSATQIESASKNSQVWHIMPTTPVLERTYEFIIVEEDLDEFYYAIEYNSDKKKYVLAKRDGHLFKTTHMSTVACPELGVSVDAAIAIWEAQHVSSTDYVKKNEDLKNSRNKSKKLLEGED